MAGKQYEVVRFHRRTDPKTLDDTIYEVGAHYSGPLDWYHLDPKGPDGQGPLIAEKSTPLPSSADSGVKDK